MKGAGQLLDRIETVAIAKLKPYENNPKVHPPEQIEYLVKHIVTYGYDQPIVVDEKYVIIKGHARLLALKQMEIKEIEVVVKTGLSEADKQAIRIADNKVAESDWDMAALNKELEALLEEGFDMSLTGFDLGEIDSLLYGDDEDGEGGKKAFGSGKPQGDRAPTEDLVPRCKTGEIWQMGRHLLLCGVDSTDWEAIAPLFEDQDPTIIYADPPYGMNCQKPDGRIGSGSKNIASKKYLPVLGDEDTSTAVKCLELCLEKWSKAKQVWWGANHYGVPPSSCWLVWDKQNGPNDFADAELAWTNLDKAVRVFRHTWNGMLKAGEASNEKRCHPNQKPVELASWVLETFGDYGDVIFDPFAGSGSSFIGAHRIEGDYTVLGAELQLEYCEMIMERFEERFGVPAQKVN